MIRVREVRLPSRSRRVRDVLGKYTTDLLGQTILVLCVLSKQAYTYDDGWRQVHGTTDESETGSTKSKTRGRTEHTGV